MHGDTNLENPRCAGALDAVRCELLSKKYGALTAVDQVTVRVPRGSVLGIGGPNGAGKTTFFDLISGVQQPTAGRIWINDWEATRSRADQFCHRGVARTFQFDVAFDSMTALENVRVATYFGAKYRASPGLIFDKPSYRSAQASLEMVGLGSQTEMVVGSMSVLERKLVMLAGALAMRPSVLLMDEPVSGLTPVEINAFQNILAGALDGSLTVIIIEHVMSFLLKLSQRLLIMHQGRIIFDGPKEEMPSNKQVVEVYLGSNALSLLSGNVPNGHS